MEERLRHYYYRERLRTIVSRFQKFWLSMFPGDRMYKFYLRPSEADKMGG